MLNAYIGHAQMVNPATDLIDANHNIHQAIKKKEDQESIRILESIGPPPYDNAKNMGQLMRVIKKYENKHSVPAPEFWWKPAAEYVNETDGQHRFDGDDYSFVHYAGHQPLGIKGMISSVDLEKEGLEFKVPVYLIREGRTC